MKKSNSKLNIALLCSCLLIFGLGLMLASLVFLGKAKKNAQVYTDSDTPGTVEQTETVENRYAAETSGSLKVDVFGDYRDGYLNDGSYKTYMDIAGQKNITVSNEAGFRGLYIEWDSLPGEYVIAYGDESLGCGTNGFLHEYIEFPQTVYEAEIRLKGPAAICCVRSFTEGELPENLQVWQEPLENADILVFPTHFDDDTLYFGALISYYAIERQKNVQCCYMVSEYENRLRKHEMLYGLWELGVRNYPVFGGFDDVKSNSLEDAISEYGREKPAEWQTEMIRRFRPSVIVGHDIEGEYGHGAHRLNASVLLDTSMKSGDESYFPDSAAEYGVWQAQKLYLHMYEENSIMLAVDEPMSRAGGESPYLKACDAFAKNESQTKYFSVEKESEERGDCRAFGLYYSLVGPDTGNDIMENIPE